MRSHLQPCEEKDTHWSDALNQHPQAQSCHGYIVDEDKLSHIHRLAIGHELLGDGDCYQICRAYWAETRKYADSSQFLGGRFITIITSKMSFLTIWERLWKLQRLQDKIVKEWLECFIHLIAHARDLHRAMTQKAPLLLNKGHPSVRGSAGEVGFHVAQYNVGLQLWVWLRGWRSIVKSSRNQLVQSDVDVCTYRQRRARAYRLQACRFRAGLAAWHPWQRPWDLRVKGPCGLICRSILMRLVLPGEQFRELGKVSTEVIVAITMLKVNFLYGSDDVIQKAPTLEEQWQMCTTNFIHTFLQNMNSWSRHGIRS